MRTMMVTVIAWVLSLATVLAGPNNPGPMEPVSIWSGQALTSTQVTSTAFYPVGLDTNISAHVQVQGLETGQTVTWKQVYMFPGSTSTYHPVYSSASSVTWTEGTNDLNQVIPITFPPGAERMYWVGQTNSTDGATITVRVNGR